MYISSKKLVTYSTLYIEQVMADETTLGQLAIF